ncbi:MAG: M48 family metalloprotease [Myxococcaceae bacterium]|nr:M48 family metalloprotease [Myxococcaceae bacterium]
MRRAVWVALLLLVSCVRNPVTGKRQLTLVSEAQEIELGQQAKAEIAQSIGLYPDERLQAYVAGIGQQLATHSERPKLPWSFQVLDDASVNAFALPGGPIFVTRGILTHLSSESELAGVLGHEIGHVTAKHSVNQMTKAQLAGLGLGLGMILSPELRQVGDLAQVAAQVLFLKYGRDDERQSDELGFKYALQQGYDVREIPQTFRTLGRVSEEAGGGRLPAWLSTHPDPGDRVIAALQRAAKVEPPQGQVRREEYLSALAGVVFGANPRQGFFVDNRFMHPDLKFQLTFPPQWKTQNAPAAVVAGSPSQDAAIQLTVAGKGSPEAAAQKFFTQEGLRAGEVSRGLVSGNPAVSGLFQAQTQQGVLEGLATFIAYNGIVYQILGLTPAGRLGNYGPLFRNTVASFEPLTDPAALNVQPARVELVKVPSEMTVEEFVAKYPSSVPAEQVVLINGLDRGQRIPAGATLKRVVGGELPRR